MVQSATKAPARVRVYGVPRSSKSYSIRDFLHRSDVDFEFVPLTTDDEARAHASISDLRDPRLPVCVFPDGTRMESPTIRQITETHRANPACNACHGVMDPLGFALENFDTIGTYRGVDAFTRTNIDTSGKLVDGTAVNGPADLRTALLAHPEQFVQTLTEKLAMYALGRRIEYYDMPAIRTIVRDAKATDYRFSSIVMGIVNAPAFRSSIVER